MRQSWCQFGALLSAAAVTTLILLLLLHKHSYKITMVSNNDHVLLFPTNLFQNHHSQGQIVGYEPLHPYRRSYLLSLFTLEQLTMSYSHFTSLVTLAHSWNMTAVEPVICHSRMYGLYNISSCLPVESKQSQLGRNRTEEDVAQGFEVNYRQLFDWEELRHTFRACLDTSSLAIDSVDDFLLHSYRNVVLIHLINLQGGVDKLQRIISRAHFHDLERMIQPQFENRKKSIVDCTRQARQSGLAKQVEQALNSNLQSRVLANSVPLPDKFVILQSVCVNIDSNATLLLEELGDLVAQKRAGVGVSVVFTKWQKKGALTKTNNQQLLNQCNSLSPPAYSKEVRHASRRFLDTLALRKPFISVHMRLERIYSCEGSYHGYLDCCLNMFHLVMKKLSHKYNLDLNNTLIIKDYGPFGSDSCMFGPHWKPLSLCHALTDNVVERLNSLGYKFAEFNPVNFPGTPANSGFVSLVEADSILSGDVLVTMGFGSFQVVLSNRFLNLSGSNKTEDLYHVCPCRLIKKNRLLERLPHFENMGPSCDTLYTSSS